jgi:hypothetical protein
MGGDSLSCCTLPILRENFLSRYPLLSFPDYFIDYQFFNIKSQVPDFPKTAQKLPTCFSFTSHLLLTYFSKTAHLLPIYFSPAYRQAGLLPG